MACTIVSTPATGAADWTGWITQQGLTDRGFMRVSLTEFATTAASLIGTGSVFELAGSIYSCSDAVAISLATGTASAAVAVYYVAIPSTGGTTCTFTMDSVAPTWVDTKQGYYASAASTSRYLGGNYIGTAATYYDKWLYQDRFSEKPRLQNTGIKIGTGSRSTAGNETFTGIGFEPSVILFFACDDTTTEEAKCWGISDSISHALLYFGVNATFQTIVSDRILYVIRTAGNDIAATVATMNGDGFTLTWTTTGTIACKYMFLCLP